MDIFKNNMTSNHMFYIQMPIVLTFIGILLLLTSLKPIFSVCRKDTHIGWCVLLVLIIFFIVGYSSILSLLWFSEEESIIYLVLSIILFSGGVFVVLVTNFSFHSILKIEKVMFYERHNALHDSLTQLPNRKYFQETLECYIKKNKIFTLLSIDLNNFKQVNDLLGHRCGDLLLIAISNALSTRLFDNIPIFRIGGDEFIIILDTTKMSAKKVVNKIDNILQEPFQILSYSIYADLSIGACVYEGGNQSLGELLKQADIAMYEAKRTQERLVFYSKELNETAINKLEISSRLKQALKENEFELWYQPIIGLAEEDVHGAEVLVRWPQKDGTYLSPEKFINIAEQSTLILDITRWILNRVVADCFTLDKQGFNGVLHINLSAKDLQDNSFYLLVKDLVDSNLIVPDNLIFEVTESAMMKYLNTTKRMMKKISALGFKFSIDDFGTGYSSLYLLKELPINQIKIDRSFVTYSIDNPADYAIVKSTIYLAKNLGCTVVAEGIENQETHTLLAQLKCDYLQGFYYSKPLPLKDFGHFEYNSKANNSVDSYGNLSP